MDGALSLDASPGGRTSERELKHFFIPFFLSLPLLLTQSRSPVVIEASQRISISGWIIVIAGYVGLLFVAVIISHSFCFAFALPSSPRLPYHDWNK